MWLFALCGRGSNFFCFGAFGGFGLLSIFASAKADSRSAGVEVLYSGLRTYRSFIGT